MLLGKPPSATELRGSLIDHYQDIDFSLWQYVQKNVQEDTTARTISWLNVPLILLDKLKFLPPQGLKHLSETTSCSFIPQIQDDVFLSHFGQSASADVDHYCFKYDFLHQRFAETYWLWAYQVANSDAMFCHSVFQLSHEIIDALCCSSHVDVLRFCSEQLQLCQFKLATPIAECLTLINYAQTDASNTLVKPVLTALRLRKANHLVVTRD